MGFLIKRKTIIFLVILITANIIFFLFYTCVYTTEDCKDIGQVRFLDAATVNGKEYTLLVRQTGFQEKVQFLLLYPHNLVFDACGDPEGNEVSNEIIDYGHESKNIVQWPVKIEIKDKQIIVHYTKNERERKPLVDIPVIWHQVQPRIK